jgi:methylthioribose-1-phosphate isomerase
MSISPFKVKQKQIWTLDQTVIPEKIVFQELRSSQDVYTAIRDMIVRGAPAIGIAAAFGMALAMREAVIQHPHSVAACLKTLQKKGAHLTSARPTAVNLAWAVDRLLATATEAARPLAPNQPQKLVLRLWDEAVAIWKEDILLNETMGRHGAELLRSGMTVLTHCNAGALATGGHGTALGVIRSAVATPLSGRETHRVGAPAG